MYNKTQMIYIINHLQLASLFVRSDLLHQICKQFHKHQNNGIFPLFNSIAVIRQLGRQSLLV